MIDEVGPTPRPVPLLELKRVSGTREVTTIGGPGRVIRVLLDPERLAAFKLAATDIRQARL